MNLLEHYIFQIEMKFSIDIHLSNGLELQHTTFKSKTFMIPVFI
jgi:hypothetical protein